LCYMTWLYWVLIIVWYYDGFKQSTDVVTNVNDWWWVISACRAIFWGLPARKSTSVSDNSIGFVLYRCSTERRSAVLIRSTVD